ncbi:hypothetical protein MMC13_000588 [Lambiella insularis]|nr:hypothetical protein [Lambiella insularis]
MTPDTSPEHKQRVSVLFAPKKYHSILERQTTEIVTTESQQTIAQAQEAKILEYIREQQEDEAEEKLLLARAESTSTGNDPYLMVTHAPNSSDGYLIATKKTKQPEPVDEAAKALTALSTRGSQEPTE